ncbi:MULTISPECIES: TetR/AcrR family transcriptional regulator [Hyphobacterium]|uniref:TetR/AcrR family transcriptional regulator n=1 Tax=Hyphobacterium vulgare TaxID=1736751 RepID=A0ABV7A126_9PROT
MAILRPKFPDHGSPFSRKQERDRKTAAIRSAASKRFDVQGVRGTRLEDIAADLGLTKTSIAYYYASKDELAEAVFLTAVKFLEDAVSAAADTVASPDQKLLLLFRTYADQLLDALDGRRAHPAQIQELDALPDEAQARITGRLGAPVAQVNEMVQDWLGQSDRALGRSEPVTFCMFALLDWLKLSANEMSGPDFRAASNVLIDVLRQGLTRAGSVPSRVTLQFSTQKELPQIFDRDARNEMKREALLKAGIRFFNLYGFEGVSLADVAASLGVTRGAFYYHIPDKESFLDQCVDHSLEAVEATLDHADEGHSGLDWIQRVLFDLIYMQASGMTPIIRLKLMAALPAKRRNRYQARLRNIWRRLGDAHDAALADGSAREHDTGTVEAILASVMFLNGGYTLAAANSLDDWRMSESPQSATNDYLNVLLFGLMAGVE